MIPHYDSCTFEQEIMVGRCGKTLFKFLYYHGSKEIIELMKMSVLRENYKAEALSAQINREVWEDACIAVDIHGAKFIKG